MILNQIKSSDIASQKLDAYFINGAMFLEKGLPHGDQDIICDIATRLYKLKQSIRAKGLGARMTRIHCLVGNKRACQAQHGFLPSFPNTKPSPAGTDILLWNKTDDRRLREQYARQCLL